MVCGPQMKTAGRKLHLSPLNWVSNENGPLDCFKLYVFPISGKIHKTNLKFRRGIGGIRTWVAKH